MLGQNPLSFRGFAAAHLHAGPVLWEIRSARRSHEGGQSVIAQNKKESGGPQKTLWPDV